MLKIDATGNIEWNGMYGRIFFSIDEMCVRAINTNGGEYAIAGSSTSILLVKTDDDGEVANSEASTSNPTLTPMATPTAKIFRKRKM